MLHIAESNTKITKLERKLELQLEELNLYKANQGRASDLKALKDSLAKLAKAETQLQKQDTELEQLREELRPLRKVAKKAKRAKQTSSSSNGNPQGDDAQADAKRKAEELAQQHGLF